MRDLNVVLALLGGVTLLLSLATGVIRRRGVIPTESILAHGITATPLTHWYGSREADTGGW